MIRCLVVDDSAAFRKVMRELLSKAPGVEVVGEAHDASSAIQMTLELKPGVVTMDVQMPGRSGIEAVAEIMRLQPTPVVVVCSGARDKNLGIEFKALQAGALEVLEKPDGSSAGRYHAQEDAIRAAVRAVGGVRLPARWGMASGPAQPPRLTPQGARSLQCLGLVASTGGPPALQRVLSGLPRDFPLPILVVQHLAPGFVEGLARWLDQACELEVKVAVSGEPLRPGVAYVGPDGYHLMASLGRVRLDRSPPVRGFRPSGTALLASLAKEYGPGAAGVVMTGMGDDGALGLQLMRGRGGLTIAQGPTSSAIYGMPKAAVDLGAAELVVELEALAPTLLEALHLPQRPLERKLLLLVDDTETVLEVERRILESRYALAFARDGQEAVRQAAKLKPHAIIMDYSMPRMNGGQALRELKVHPTTRAIPVIIVTSETAPRILDECRDSGCHALLKKPLDAAQLVETVARFVPP